MLKNIVFDMGNVILDFSPRRMTGYFTSDPEATDIICRELFSNKEWLELDRGVTDEETALCGILKRVPEKYHDLCRKIIYGWYEYFLPIEGTYEQIVKLKERGFGLYTLTNAALTFRTYCRNSPAFGLMDGILVSSEEKLMKPEPEIYIRLLEKFGLKACECLFIDDSAPNVKTAEDLGFYGHVFGGDPAEIEEAVNEIVLREQI